jgi:disulfide bond formation protein DsbB
LRRALKNKTELMKKNLPLVLIIASAILIIANFIFSEGYDLRFWMTTLSGVLIIISMVLTIRENKKQG